MVQLHSFCAQPTSLIRNEGMSNQPDAVSHRVYGCHIVSPFRLPAPLSCADGSDLQLSYHLSLRSASLRPVRPVRTCPRRRAFFLHRPYDSIRVVGDSISVIPEITNSLACQGDLIKSVVPVLLALRGECLLHASAFADGEGATVVLGESGAGKSTFAALAEQAGLRHLADDICRLTLCNGQLVVYPSGTGKTLIPPAEDAVKNRRHGAVLHHGKWWLPENDSTYSGTPVPLKRVLLLSTASGKHVSLTHDDGLKALIRGTICLHDFHHHLAPRHLPLFSLLLRSIPVCLHPRGNSAAHSWELFARNADSLVTLHPLRLYDDSRVSR